MGIYTKTGDKGETSLLGGQRVLKSDVRIASYGEVDELNSCIGVLVASLDEKKYQHEITFLMEHQSRLFDLGALLASSKVDREKFKLTSLSSELVPNLESEIDQYQANLPKLTNFILPGGGISASFCHQARTVCRRAERAMVIYQREFTDDFPTGAIEYINRLSDYFFALARYLGQGREVIWQRK